jgi:hypothetical protein
MEGRTNGRTEGSVTISLRYFVGEGIKKNILRLDEKYVKNNSSDIIALHIFSETSCLKLYEQEPLLTMPTFILC